jgi:hypothetical protein
MFTRNPSNLQLIISAAYIIDNRSVLVANLLDLCIFGLLNIIMEYEKGYMLLQLLEVWRLILVYVTSLSISFRLHFGDTPAARDIVRGHEMLLQHLKNIDMCLLLSNALQHH